MMSNNINFHGSGKKVIKGNVKKIFSSKIGQLCMQMVAIKKSLAFVLTASSINYMNRPTQTQILL